LQILVMRSQLVDVSVGDVMRLETELPSQGESGALGRGELRPIAVQCRDLFFLQARDRELDFLVAQSVMTVVGSRHDPE